MSEADPPPSKNPFIRFKQHVDARIGTGISVMTGSSWATSSNSAQPSVSEQQQQQEQVQPKPQPQQHPQSQPQSAHSFFFDDDIMPFPCPRSHHRDPASQFWNEWAQVSPYSPYNLRHLPQPVPKDLPVDAVADAHLFGFEDAFEDLLACTSTTSRSSQPLPLLDLRRQAAYKREVRATFPQGEPPLLWVDRLRNRGLLRGGFPPRAFFGGMRGGGDGGRWRDRWDDGGFSEDRGLGWEAVREWRWRRAMMDRPEELERVEERRRRQSSEGERARDVATPWQQPQQQQEVVPNKEDSWLDVLVSQMDGSSTEKTSKNQSWNTQQQQKQQPDTEEDLFSAIDSAFAKAEGSVRDFFKAFADDTSVTAQNHQHQHQYQYQQPAGNKNAARERVREEPNDLGGKTVTTTSEHVDMFGYVHHKTDVQRLDASGRQVSSETRYDIRPGGPKDNKKDDREKSDSPMTFAAVQEEKSWSEDGSGSGNGSGNKPSGWFWR